MMYYMQEKDEFLHFAFFSVKNVLYTVNYLPVCSINRYYR